MRKPDRLGVGRFANACERAVTLPHPALYGVQANTYRYRGRILRRITVEGHTAWMVGGAQYRQLKHAMLAIDDSLVPR